MPEPTLAPMTGSPLTASGTLISPEMIFAVPQDGQFTSAGAIKVPDARPERLAFEGFFTPTTVMTRNGLASAFPGPRNG